jgi:hypothetical protein
MRQLYELTRGIVEPYVGTNPKAPRLEDQVEDLITITLDVIFSGGLKKPSSLPHFIETLARHWNRAPLEIPKHGVAFGLKRGTRIPFLLLDAK